MKNTKPINGFATETVVLHTDPEVLQNYLFSRGICGDVNCQELHKEHGKRIYSAYLGRILEKEMRTNTALLQDFCMVYVLAKKNAFLTFQQELILQRKIYTDCLSQYASSHDKLFWLLEKERQTIENSYYAEFARGISNRYWLNRPDVIPPDMPALSVVHIEKLKNAVVAYLAQESRGGPCRERLFSNGNKDYIILATSDHSLAAEYWTADGILEPRLLSPKMEIIFCLDRNRCCLNVHADSPVTRKEMQKILARELCSKEIPDEPEGKAHYDMDTVLDEIIRQQQLSPKIQGITPVKDVWVNAIRLQLRSGGEITINAQQRKRTNEEGKPDKIYSLLRKIVQVEEARKRSIQREDITPVWMQFVVAFKDTLTGKEATTRFTFTSKNGANLGHSDLEEAIRTCLMDSGYINSNVKALIPITTHGDADATASLHA